ncbi:MAG: 2,4-dichlorophenol 6-monooxygenase, partial [Actinomycetales bacterium]
VGGVGMGVLRMVRPWNRWMAVWGYDITGERPVMDDAAARAIVHELLGDRGIEVVIESASVWSVNESSASRYSDGRVFCAGDAVHRHSPANGLGSNTSAQDSYNLAWKLAAVIKGVAGPGLLDTYDAERVPVGQQVVERASRSASDFGQLFNALGLGDGKASARLEDGLDALQVPDAAGAARRRALARAVELKHDEFSAHGVEMNQRYTSSAVIPADDGPEVWARDSELYHQASTRPGAKLPHVWLTDLEGRRISTLDLVGKGAFTLMTGLSGVVWDGAAQSCGEVLGLKPRVARIGVTALDVYGTWSRVTQHMDEAGALLVRPDGQVAWRHDSAVTDVQEASTLLVQALGTILHRPSASPS